MPRTNFWDLAGIRFHKRQTQAAETVARCKHVLYGGAMGGGKSFFLRWAMIWLLIEKAVRYRLPGLRAMLACESYPALRDRQITRIQAEVPPWLGTWRQGAHELRLRCRTTDGLVLDPVLCLRNLDDPGKYLSAEFPFIGIDELTRNPREVFDALVTRQRWPGLPQRECRFIAATNPGGIGHAWVKRLWIDRQFGEGDDPDDYAYVPARAVDNPSLPREYERSLDRLPDRVRAAYRDGSWDVFAGQMFTQFDLRVHVVDRFPIPRQWERTAAIDYGYSPGYSAVVWVATDPERGWSYIYRELYEQELTPTQLAQEILRQSRGERISGWRADPSLWARSESTGRPNADVLIQHGVPIQPANNDRVEGWRRMHEYLRVFDAPWPDYLPGRDAGEYAPQARLRLFRDCYNAIRCLPTLVHREIGDPEDARKGGEDHLPDACRYWCLSRPARETVERDKSDLAEEADETWFRKEFPNAYAAAAGRKRRQGY